MFKDIRQQLDAELKNIEADGLYKKEREIISHQKNEIQVLNGTNVINMCANNYLGLSSHPEILQAAKEGIEKWGYGLSSVRFICGTQSVHKELEKKLSDFLEMEDTILYGSCFDANGGLFETILSADDAIISDELNHASIIDGIRLCKAQRYRYKNADMQDLENNLKEASQKSRRMLIATDGVFSMDGTIAPLDKICDLANKYNAMVMVDDSHAVGFLGKNGKGTHEHCQVLERVDIITGTLGKALGGASGGYTSAKKEIVDMLRQRSRPYLFSNSLAPMIAHASLKALEIIARGELQNKLWENTKFFRNAMTENGFDIIPGIHPIVPVMLYDAKKAQSMAEKLLAKGVYAIGFFFPVVPQGKARIRTQVSAGHTKEDLEKTIQAFIEVRG